MEDAKAKKKAARRAYYLQNREKEIERAKQYRIEHIEQVKEREQQYREENRDVILEKKREHYQANKDTELARGKQWRESNKDKVKELSHKNWIEVRKVKRKNDWATILTKKLDSLRIVDEKKGRDFNIDKDYVNSMIQEANNKCKWCSKECKFVGYENRDMEQWSIDRIDNNFGHIQGNIVLSCLHCNIKRH